MQTESRRSRKQDVKKQFENLSYPLLDKLYTTAFRLTQNKTDAEDLVQSTYLRAFRYFDRFKADTNFNAWMYRILTNLFINQYNRKKRIGKLQDFELTSLTHPSEEPSESVSSKKEDTELHIDQIFDDSIFAALNKLPDAYRTVLLLSAVNELTYKEIAEILVCPIGTVMSRINRGRKALARLLRSYAVKNRYIN